ncbi:MAG: hypothetical protein H7A23_06760 [Leptospiraceae bacterium]|nr:hypothetical protein [Leptospiraceae bacterium]MCP5494241.1 hypothetical protein [Leptospiraceae bacterium]
MYYWNCDTDGRRLLAFLLAYFRDFYVRISIPFILDIPYGEILSVEYLIEKLRYKTYENITEKTLQSLVRNLRSTFSQSGHLTGKVKKTRINPSLSSGAISFALLLGYLEGMRGELLFQSEYMKSIECSPERGYNFAYDASSRGWLDFKKAGNIVEVSFSNFTKQKRNKS